MGFAFEGDPAAGFTSFNIEDKAHKRPGVTFSTDVHAIVAQLRQNVGRTFHRNIGSVVCGFHADYCNSSWKSRQSSAFSKLYSKSVADYLQIQASLPATTPITSSDNSEPNPSALPPPPIAIQLTPLLGSAPSDRIQTLHNLYASQIATIVWLAESENPLQINRKNVVVGIALRRSSENSDSDLSESERTTFYGVMAAIKELLRGNSK